MVYNLRIADYHTYFVGSRDWGFSVWAHNAGYDLKQIKAMGSQMGWNNAKTHAFGDFVEELKASGFWDGVSKNSTLTWAQLEEALEQFLRESEGYLW